MPRLNPVRPEPNEKVRHDLPANTQMTAAKLTEFRRKLQFIPKTDMAEHEYRDSIKSDDID